MRRTALFADYFGQHLRDVKVVKVPGEDLISFLGDADRAVEEIETFLTGARPEIEADRVLATVLFTDIVESTTRAVEMGDRRWAELLERHRGLVRAEFTRFRGREIDTIGDGFLATFDGPARAVRCAAAIAESVRTLGLEIRAGVHTGEIELRGDDVTGVAVHIASRISCLAGAGEVLVSRTVTDLVAGSGIEFEDRGEHELKGVPGDWRLFAASG
jgi:class 3 adenylate cyclase